MADAPSPPSSDLSEPPSIDSEPDEPLSTAATPSSRPSVDMPHPHDGEIHAPPPKRRKTAATGGPSASASALSLSLSTFDRAPSSQPAQDQDDDSLSISSDGWSDAPGSPSQSEWTLRDEAQTACLWRDCPFGEAGNNDELVKHVQATHCATGGPKRTKYVCEWGECQRKTSNHPSGYALKAHMRSHTKEKPYYCQLPECDKAFTRSDALAKHMRTVHEPEQPRGGAAATATSAAMSEPTPPGKKNGKQRLTNGFSTPTSSSRVPPPAPTTSLAGTGPLGPTHDEDGNEITPSPANDNITYIPAHHPITGQPGFMIHYPPDIQFTAWESAIAADQLMRLLRRQLRWAEREQDELRAECASLEQKRKEEWTLKEILLEGVMEAEWARGQQEGLLRDVAPHVRELMERDVQPAKQLAWTPTTPEWRRARPVLPPAPLPLPSSTLPYSHSHAHQQHSGQHVDMDGDMDVPDAEAETPERDDDEQRTPSPPPTGRSAGFDGEGQPYDNYLADRMAEMERLRAERRRYREEDAGMAPKGQHQREEADADAEAEADAVGALMGMSGGQA
ncbi:hypothetical protein LTR36_009077 [Oleoguttula mirabilis]|uniref:C2H2-type domain-containing protein n=1 Tax=Oleoguttula mirabilis TaxID=1507867 RepID=A0AAV9J6M0_9PEZI|nr:hypothetical protein LTR36_009077 [Oleoguttula mirabilis]